MGRQDEAVPATRVSILGAGSWGLTLAQMLGRKENYSVNVFCRDADRCLRLSQLHIMDKPREQALPPAVRLFSELKPCLDADYIIAACTSQGLRSLLTSVAELKVPVPVLISAVKGLELQTHMRMSEVVASVLPETRVAVLSGPNLAMEVLNGMPTASVVAASDLELAKSLRSVLSAPKFRVYANDDLVGVELGGTLKNVIAIAAGACDGLGLGVNAKASLLTRGLAEMSRLAVKLGAKPTTLAGLAGMGDLFATCESQLSRNYQVGFGLARGQGLDQILTELGQVAEGVTTTHAVCELSIRLGLELPIAEQVESTLRGISTPAGAIMALLSRPLANE
ncbi:MAG TPA: NAD(P)H-dependent glycerol-3-phosphate dehydrogenase [Candidatus Obscuribacter sp.]|nr:NAD(P)H-dependent glycerol-3-phosphate dehydrogenase [Candidatus Obscuribacter sp.]HMY55926.1 NAD(P)H-dependent glycerol-3-phosphate dehydrogenase [Candidatus Obscuribacter sp.]HNB14086.1 NAD(P)H-dependent glycerol-3-phosphate dehydrogenase [Candidatus Obscuribacter sp.]